MHLMSNSLQDVKQIMFGRKDRTEDNDNMIDPMIDHNNDRSKGLWRHG